MSENITFSSFFFYNISLIIFFLKVYLSGLLFHKGGLEWKKTVLRWSCLKLNWFWEASVSGVRGAEKQLVFLWGQGERGSRHASLSVISIDSGCYAQDETERWSCASAGTHEWTCPLWPCCYIHSQPIMQIFKQSVQPNIAAHKQQSNEHSKSSFSPHIKKKK